MNTRLVALSIVFALLSFQAEAGVLIECGVESDVTLEILERTDTSESQTPIPSVRNSKDLGSLAAASSDGNSSHQDFVHCVAMNASDMKAASLLICIERIQVKISRSQQLRPS